MNAARHSGAPAIAVYVEVEPEQVSVFVRDRGRGFDPAAVPARPRRHRRVDHRPHAAQRRHRGGAVGVRCMGTEVELYDAPCPAVSGDAARLRVFLVDDHDLFRSGVRVELGATSTSSARRRRSTPPSR